MEDDTEYVPPQDPDDYMVMHPKLEKDSVLIIHTHDGQPIADCVKANLQDFTQLKIKVKVCDIAEIQNQTLNSQVALVLITPEIISYFEENGDSAYPALQFPEKTVYAFSIHESVTSKNEEDIRKMLKRKIPGAADWKAIKMRYQRTATVEILGLLDQQCEKQLFPAILQYHLEPDYILTDRHPVLILFKSKKASRSSVCVHVDGRQMNARYLNPYTYSFVPQGLPCGKLLVNVSVDGQSEGTTHLTVGNKMDLLFEEIKDLISPIEFLGQVLNLTPNDRENLDRELGDIMNENHIGNFSILDDLGSQFSCRDQKLDKEYPTILHFAAKYGLECFCKVLSKVPGFQIAKTIQNKDGLIPSQIARKMNFLELSEELNGLESKGTDYSMLKQDSGSFNRPPLKCKSRERTPLESSEVIKRSPKERDEIYRHRKASGLSANSKDSGISAWSTERDEFEEF